MRKTVTRCRGARKLTASGSAKSSSSGAGIDALCDVAAAANGGEGQGPAGQLSQGLQRQVVEIEAFSSVHDMIHAAILHYGPSASLKQIYQACQESGRIAYKRTGGSRLITHNDHWKSQIRHALYTSGKFARLSPGSDAWTISKSHSKAPPSVTMVTIIADGADEEDPAASVCGEASHVGADEGAAATGGAQETSQATRMSLRTRVQPKRTPKASTRYTRGKANLSRANSKEGTAINFEEDAESVGGHSQSEEPTPARPIQRRLHQTVSASPSITIQDVLSKAIVQTTSGHDLCSPFDVTHFLLNSPATRARLASDESAVKHPLQALEGGAETIGIGQGVAQPRNTEAPAEDLLGASGNRPGELCSSHTVAEPGIAMATPVPQMSAPSGLSVEADSPPVRDAKRLQADPSACGSVPLKKRLKAAAAKAFQAEQERQAAPTERDLSRNRRKPLRCAKGNEAPTDALPVTPLSKDGSVPAMVQEAKTTARRPRTRPPKAAAQQTRAATLTPGGLTPSVATPANVAPSAIFCPTPLTLPQATPKTGIVTRRRSAGRSPPEAGAQGRGSWSSSGPEEFKTAAVAILKAGGQPLGMKDLSDRAVQRSLVHSGRLPEHAMASALYMDIELNEATPFTAECDGKFGLRGWAAGH